MSRLKTMLHAHPSPAGENGDQARDCIEACFDCAEICSICADACLAEQAANMLVQCIRLNLDCADICDTSAGFMARGSDLHGRICAACADVCERCAEECERFPDDETMRRCAEICRRTAQSCREMVQVAAWIGSRDGSVNTQAEREALMGPGIVGIERYAMGRVRGDVEQSVFPARW